MINIPLGEGAGLKKARADSPTAIFCNNPGVLKVLEKDKCFSKGASIDPFWFS